MQAMLKKNPMMIAGIVITLLVVVTAGVGAYMFTKSKTAPAQETKVEEKKKKRVDQFNTLVVSERPYVLVKPLASGRDVQLAFNEIKKPAETVEYELEYQAGELLQGAFGELPLSPLPATKDILLGSRSAGGATTYHENVQGGSLVTRFSGTNTYAHKNDWRFIDNKAREKALGSKDAKFQIESAELAKQRFVIISTTPGYPGELPGTPVSEIYALSTPGTLSGAANVTIRANEDLTEAQLAIWNGSSWETVDGAIDGKTITATATLNTLYTVVKK
jgi:hypothetical protein